MGVFRQVFMLGMMFSGASLIGYESGYLNGVLASPDFIYRYGVPDATGTYYLTATTRSLFTSIQIIGTLIGCLANGFIINFFGRKGALTAASVAYAIGCAIQLGGVPFAAFLIGRIILGFAAGIISTVIPPYLIEASSAHNRGRFMAFFLQFLTSGNVVACSISMGTAHYADSRGWRVTVAFQLVIALAIFVGSILCPESPSILVLRGKVEAARKSLSILKNMSSTCQEIDQDIAGIEAGIVLTDSAGNVRWIECFQGTNLRRTSIGVTMGALTILTGCNFWFGYGTTFFEQVGVGNSYLISLILSIVNFVFTSPSIYLIEKIGRRNTLMIGAAVMGLTQLLSGIIHSVIPNSSADNKMLVAGAIIFIAFYASTWGIGGWVIMCEPFSDRLRVHQTTITMIVYWITTWFIGFIVPYLVDSTKADLGPNISYIWAAFCVISAIWTYLCVPEFAGLSQLELDSLFQERVSAWRSKSWVRNMGVIEGAEMRAGKSCEDIGATANDKSSSAISTKSLDI